jgi:hypothetical protein
MVGCAWRRVPQCKLIGVSIALMGDEYDGVWTLFLGNETFPTRLHQFQSKVVS